MTNWTLAAAHVGDPWGSFLRFRYGLVDYWTGEDLEIDDKIYLATTWQPASPSGLVVRVPTIRSFPRVIVYK